ncbi:MAG TPA: DUF4091 domain-containing protein [Candidatus Paceibacterota bacterium]|nr:DUF4091 domain-containing protein [Verrucomicrobiota bacterium]HSA09424.1 DUF4091 domain-containing protein [Candidatus Paceibacterota bacterium]
MILRTGLVLLALLLAQTLQAATQPTGGPMIVEPDGKAGPSIAFWLESSLKRVFPASAPGTTNLQLLAARNGRIAFQACLQNRRVHPLTVECSVSGGEDLKPQVRRVGYVPLLHYTPDTEPAELDGFGLLPGLVPDPLFPEIKATVAPWENQSFWITLTIPADTKPGVRELKVHYTFHNGTQHAGLPVRLEIAPLVIQPRRGFDVIHWWRGEAIWDYYQTGMFDEKWWELTRAYMTNMLAHGSDVVYVPLFFNRRETFRRPCQLLTVNSTKPDVYEFDWAQAKRFTDMARSVGFRKFEWPHLWIYWGVENPIRAYTQRDGKWVMLWPPDTKATSDIYLAFLKQFLPAFHRFLEKENILADSYFHLSDEPSGGQHVENYKRARKVLRELAPWMKVMDALSDVEYGRQGLTDIPIPIVSSAQAYIDEKIPHWVYYCCAPHGPWLNRFLDTPLPKVRMSGWLFYRLGAQGFLHWGYNYWHKIEQEAITDPFTDASAAAWPGIPYGDPFMVYPGEKGPIDSIRWEVFAESLQDYAMLQSAGIKPDDPLLAPLKSYADFPKSEDWLRTATGTLLKRAEVGKQP